MSDDIAQCFIHGKADTAGIGGGESQPATERIHHLPDDGEVGRSAEEVDAEIEGRLTPVLMGLGVSGL